MTALADDPFDIVWDPAAGDLADAEVARLAADLGTDAIIAEGEAMLAARWDAPFGSPQDAYELANAEVLTNPSTGERVEQWTEIREGAPPPERDSLAGEEREETLSPLEQIADEAHREEWREALEPDDDA